MLRAARYRSDDSNDMLDACVQAEPIVCTSATRSEVEIEKPIRGVPNFIYPCPEAKPKLENFCTACTKSNLLLVVCAVSVSVEILWCAVSVVLPAIQNQF